MVDTCERLPKRERPVFKTIGEAKIACQKYRTQLKNQGVDCFVLSNKEREDAVKALVKCRQLGYDSLEEAIEKLGTFVDPPAGHISIGELREEFMAYYSEKVKKKNRSERQLDTIRKRSQALVALFGQDQKVSEISPRHAWNTIYTKSQNPDPSKPDKTWAPRTLRRYCTVLNQMFDHAVNKKYLVNNPLKDNDITFEMETAMEPEAQKAPELLSIQQAQDLLIIAHKENHHRGLLAYTAICLFTGARPEAEAAKLTWDDIELAEEVIHIRRDKSKNDSSQRTLEIHPTLLEWILLCDQKKPLVPCYQVKHVKEHTKKVGTSKYNPLEHHWRQTRSAANLPKAGDLTRHSFATYSYALHLDKYRLQNELGHTSGQMIKHYLEVSTGRKKVAEAYFNLSPKKVLMKYQNCAK